MKPPASPRILSVSGSPSDDEIAAVAVVLRRSAAVPAAAGVPAWKRAALSEAVGGDPVTSRIDADDDSLDA